jgi:hypothetical protein
VEGDKVFLVGLIIFRQGGKRGIERYLFLPRTGAYHIRFGRSAIFLLLQYDIEYGRLHVFDKTTMLSGLYTQYNGRGGSKSQLSRHFQSIINC